MILAYGMGRFSLVVLAAAACSRPPAVTTAPQALITCPAAACDVPAAVPNDGLDDRAAIQAALNVNGCVHLGDGEYDIDTPLAIPPAGSTSSAT